MRAVIVAAVGGVLNLGLLVEPVVAACPAHSVESGTVCMDTYEASVWYVPPGETGLITRIRNGTATLANLTSAGAVAAGVVQLGLAFRDLEAAGCPITGNGCLDVYALSIPGVLPARFLSWFQAAAAARNAFKRLPTNQEWQVAALGTRRGNCNTHDQVPGVAPTGSRVACVSDVGAFDMVGNVWEWVAEWGDRANGCELWPEPFSGESCVGGSGAINLPGAWLRGGDWRVVGEYRESRAGVFTVDVLAVPSALGSNVGFRCAR